MTSMGEDDDESRDDVPNVDQIIGSFLKETSLWPVLIVVLGSAGAFGAALLILVGVDRNPFAAVALLLIVGMTVDVVVRARRERLYRNLARLVGLIWSVAIVLTGVAIWSGIAF
jgi:hypothetical protein